jgi:hypothetical protein
MPANQKALAAYLTDHMAGSVSAADLAERAAAGNQGPVAEFFAGLAREIEADRRTLRLIAEHCDIEPSAVKEAAAVAGERLSRFKIDHRITSNPALSLLLELELLYLGIQGKSALWRTLRTVSAGEPRLADFNFDELERSADQQLAAVEEQRVAAAARALSG